MDGLDNRPVNAWAQGWVRLAGVRVAREGIFMRTHRQDSMAAGRRAPRSKERGLVGGPRGGSPSSPQPKSYYQISTQDRTHANKPRNEHTNADTKAHMMAHTRAQDQHRHAC